MPEPPASTLTAPAGAGGSWEARAQAAIERGEYQATQVAQGFQAPNRVQNLRAWFRGAGVEVVPRTAKHGAWSWTWQTTAWGRSGRMRALTVAAPEARGSRVEYRRGGMVEWYENLPGGLEQGFTIADRPAGEGRVRVEGKVSDRLRARASAGGDAVSFFADHAGAPVLRYGSLAAFDALGKKLEARLEVARGSLAIEVDDRGASYPLTIDPMVSTPAWSAEGNQDGANLGYSVATAGDVNGDGFSDVIVGAYQFDNGQADEGRAFVYWGSPTGLRTVPQWTAESNQAGSFFGVSVASAGDVNGDGYSDVIVGAEFYDGGQTDEGRAYVYLGSASGLAASPAWTAESDQGGSSFGISVATAGDVNGDHYDDVIIGASQYSQGQVAEGRAYVYLGSSAGLAAVPVWTAESDQASAFFGNSVATAGDVNGDGYDDVVVGAHHYSNGQAAEGRAYLYLGSPSGPGVAAAWTAEGNQAGAFFGNTVAAAGDVNGDGFSDVVIGASSFDDGQTDEGRVFLYLGSATGLGIGPAWAAESNVAGAAFGWSVATAGDVNGDGYSDVIVGAYAFNSQLLIGRGRAYVYDGSATGLGEGPAWIVDGSQSGGFFGCSVATAGDVNRDGYSDIIVGAYAFDDGESDEGGASVYLGAATGLPIAGAWVGESNQAHAHFGFSVAPAGDVNGDGYPDVLIGAPWYDHGQSDEGGAFVYLGFASGLRLSPSWTAESDQDAALFGYSVAAAGDVNGDGYADVIVGAYQYDDGETDEGRAFVYLGSATGLMATPAWTAESDQTDARFGYSVATAGDVNGDGYDDVIVGAHRYDNGQIDEGRATVFLGSAAGLAATPAWSAEGNQGGADFGSSVACAGDVNGDGYSDVIVGSRTFDHGENNEGRAFVYLGGAAGLAAAPAWTGESDQAEARFGWSVASAGDVNGDGYSDVIVGAYLYDGGETDEGRAYVFHGSASGLGATPAWTAEIDQAGAAFGCSVANAGDINRDGCSDVVVGAYLYDGDEVDEGAAFLYRGSPYGLPVNPTWIEGSHQANAWFGWSVAGAGDLNHNGYPDVIVGAQKFDAGSDNEGRAYVYWDLHSPVATTEVRETRPPTGGPRLESIAPNPSRSLSVVRYVLPRAGAIRLSIHDLLGRRVAALVDGFEEAGAHSAAWDGRDERGTAVPAGIYWARLEAGGERVASKLIRGR
ncbi:MAG TPA: FG-GAP-like repeat-containing protein [Candidatus Eisenbacteria bacterium]